MTNKLGGHLTTNQNMFWSASCTMGHKYNNQQPTTVSKQVEQIYYGKESPFPLQIIL